MYLPKTFKYTTFALLVLLASCNGDDEPPVSYLSCDQELGSTCPRGTDDPFCTFGYKWGSNNAFSSAGRSQSGPATPGGTITYHFREAGYLFNMHSQNGISSRSFDDLSQCARNRVREAFRRWEAVANITFQETTNAGQSDIVLLVGDIGPGAVAYPPFVDEKCQAIAGQVIFDVPTRDTCDRFMNLALHEIGHVLGLGHVGSDNIMNPDWDDTVTELQPGDIVGIQSIYGVK
ncbi:MAG: matrixin family metalloprotease [Tunicatimonas sp.]